MLVIEGLGEVRFKLKPVQARGQNGGLFCRQIGVVFVRQQRLGLGFGLCGLLRCTNKEGGNQTDSGVEGLANGFVFEDWL